MKSKPPRKLSTLKEPSLRSSIGGSPPLDAACLHFLAVWSAPVVTLLLCCASALPYALCGPCDVSVEHIAARKSRSSWVDPPWGLSCAKWGGDAWHCESHGHSSGWASTHSWSNMDRRNRERSRGGKCERQLLKGRFRRVAGQRMSQGRMLGEPLHTHIHTYVYIYIYINVCSITSGGRHAGSH